MRRMRIEVLCDLHGEHDATGEVTITLGNRSRVLDLCDEGMAVVTELFDLGIDPAKLNLDARPKRRVKAEPENYCRECQQEYASRQSLGVHLRATHGVGLRDAPAAGLIAA